MRLRFSSNQRCYKHERLVGFSCKGSAVCSSCVGRKMNELSLHLMDHVVPDVPLRQFVFTLPFALRVLVARDALRHTPRVQALARCGAHRIPVRCERIR